MAGDGADIIELRPKAPDDDAPITTKPREPGKQYCRHRRLTLDDDVKRTYCRDCDAEVNNFEALLILTREWDRYRFYLDQAKREARQAATELKEVKRQVRNAKAQLRRATK